MTPFPKVPDCNLRFTLTRYTPPDGSVPIVTACPAGSVLLDKFIDVIEKFNWFAKLLFCELFKIRIKGDKCVRS